MLSARAIVDRQDLLTQAGHIAAAPDANVQIAGPECVWLEHVARQHRANFALWHIEDEARTPGAADAVLAQVKRRIDRTNQLRNDLAEELDRFLLEWLAPQGLPRSGAPLHSESPGLMIDRLSILALKIYHTHEEMERANAAPEHGERNRARLAILTEQRGDLAGCLDALWQETLAGTRRFKIYRQMKMYNDPTLNPAIYANQKEMENGD